MFTLDLDYCSKEKLDRIIEKICSCLRFQDAYLSVEDTWKGYHIKVYCKAGSACNRCRLVFDDDKRFFGDHVRSRFGRKELGDILFGEKWVWYGGRWQRVF